MVAHFTMLTFGVILRHFDFLKAFGHIEGIVKVEKKILKRPILNHMCATCSELPYYVSTVDITVCAYSYSVTPPPR